MIYQSNDFDSDEQLNIESIHLNFRNCALGEQLMNTGECVKCPAGTYLIKQSELSNFKMNICIKCPSTGICFGGKINIMIKGVKLDH